MTEHVFDSALQRYISRIMRFDGAAWSESLVLNPAAVSAVVTTSTAVWAAGADGLWRFDGTRWTSVHGSLGHYVQLAADGDRVWAAGQEPSDGSTVVAFDGSRWSATARLEAPFRPFELHVGADGTLWGVDGGRLLRRAP